MNQIRAFFVKFITIFLVVNLFNTDLKAQVSMLDNEFSKTILFACNELKIDSIEIITSYAQFDSILITKVNYIARVQQLGPKLFCINIKEDSFKKEVNKALLHEVYHIRQILDNRLRMYIKCVWFEGKLYDNKIPYEDRPWEVEAGHNEYLLWNKYKKQNKL